jgi:hypothetical protein
MVVSLTSVDNITRPLLGVNDCLLLTRPSLEFAIIYRHPISTQTLNKLRVTNSIHSYLCKGFNSILLLPSLLLTKRQMKLSSLIVWRSIDNEVELGSRLTISPQSKEATANKELIFIIAWNICCSLHRIHTHSSVFKHIRCLCPQYWRCN